MSEAKDRAAWEATKAVIPGLNECLQPPERYPEDAENDFEQTLMQLPEEFREALRSYQQVKQEPCWHQGLKPVWVLCDMAEGEFPKVYQYATLQELTEAMERSEGRETALVVMYGARLSFTKLQVTNEGKHYRYLHLPNGMAAVIGGQFKLVDQSLLPADAEIEEQGWVGDPAYLETSTYYQPGYVPHDQFSTDPDLDDDAGDGESVVDGDE